jgi:hypothetical protein
VERCAFSLKLAFSAGDSAKYRRHVNPHSHVA